LPRGKSHHFRTKPSDIEPRACGCHHLNRATGEAHWHWPETGKRGNNKKKRDVVATGTSTGSSPKATTAFVNGTLGGSKRNTGSASIPDQLAV